MIYLSKDVMTPHEFGLEVERVCKEYEDKLEIMDQYVRKVKEDIKTEARRWKDEEFEQLEEREKLTYGQFTYPQEMERWQLFCKKHNKCRYTYHANDALLPYIMPSYGCSGTVFAAYCPICDEKEDITYYKGW